MISQWRYMEKGVDHDVQVIVPFDVVQANIAWDVGFIGEVVGWFL